MAHYLDLTPNDPLFPTNPQSQSQSGREEMEVKPVDINISSKAKIRISANVNFVLTCRLLKSSYVIQRYSDTNKQIRDVSNVWSTAKNNKYFVLRGYGTSGPYF